MNPEAASGGQKPGAWQRAQQFLEADRKKIGGMTPGAMGRLGMAELREAFSPGGNVAQPTPYGMYGTLTPGEVGAVRKDDDPQLFQMEEEPQMSDANRLPSPAEIAYGQDRGNVQGPDRGPSHEQGQGFGQGHDGHANGTHEMGNARQDAAGPQHGQEHDHGMSR